MYNKKAYNTHMCILTVLCLASFAFEDIHYLSFQPPILVYGYADIFQGEILILWRVCLYMKLMGSSNVIFSCGIVLLTDTSFCKEFKAFTG